LVKVDSPKVVKPSYYSKPKFSHAMQKNKVVSTFGKGIINLKPVEETESFTDQTINSEQQYNEEISPDQQR
jgi:hypothetical protein